MQTHKIVSYYLCKVFFCLLICQVLSSCQQKIETKKPIDAKNSLSKIDTLTLSNTFLEVKLKTQGAELISIKSKQTGFEYLWQGDTISWADHAIVQFPIVCNVKNDRYQYQNKEYEIMSHGFGRVSHYSVLSKNDTSIVLGIESSPYTKKMYPFDFEYKVKYHLDGNKVIATFDIKNTGNDIMYYSSGYHPGFNCPLDSTSNFADYALTFEKTETLESLTLENGMVTSKKRPFLDSSNTFLLSKKAFEQDVFILENPKSEALTITRIDTKDARRSISLHFGNVPYLGIWSPAKSSPFICIEPWFGLPDDQNDHYDLNNKKAIQQLKPQKEFEWDFTMEFIETHNLVN